MTLIMKRDTLLPNLEGIYMDAVEAFPGVVLWEEFDKTCKQAEAVRDRAVQEATRERDQVINPVSVVAWAASDRVQRAANARYEAKLAASQAKCDKECENAQAELTRALDQRADRALWDR
jgi:endo-alpha-1,4-polygalactosaminidase (GH114 family)